jgi:vacuolar-type H+-ATPase subunit H
MIRKLMLGLGAVALVGFVGCEAAKDTASQATKKAAEGTKAVADKAGDMGKEAMEKAKGEFLKPIEEMLPKAEEKIKALTGDKMTGAKKIVEELMALIKGFKEAPADKFKDLMGGITEKVTALKSAIGL